MTGTVESEFRQAMRRLATTVALITAGRGDERSGMAATAVVSVSTTPPTLLVAVNSGASIHSTLSTKDHFCVNLLSPRHAELVGAFSGKLKGLERFGLGEWTEAESGAPILVDALASIVCRITLRLDVGTHTLFVGEAETVENHAEIAPLIWMDGGFASAVPA